MDSEDHDSISLEEPTSTLKPVIPQSVPIENGGKVNEAVTALQEAVPQVRTWMADIHEWELMEPAAGNVLAFVHRHQEGVYRVAGRLCASADAVITRLKDHNNESRLRWDSDVEHVECTYSFSDNMEHVRSLVQMPFGLTRVTLDGIQHTTYMEESRTYFYLFTSLPISTMDREPDAQVTVGVTVRELDKDTGCEINAVFRCWWHTHWSVAWLIDPLLVAHFFNAERMVRRAHLYEKK